MANIAVKENVTELRESVTLLVDTIASVNVNAGEVVVGMTVESQDLNVVGDMLGGRFKVVAGGTYSTTDSYYILNDASLTAQLIRLDWGGDQIADSIATHAVANLYNKTTVLARGGATSGDGLGGLFEYNATSTATVDNVDTWMPVHGTGRYIRVTDGRVSTRVFANVYADDPRFASYKLLGGDTLALQTAINLAASLGVGVELAERTYTITRINWVSGLKYIRGKSWRTTELKRQASDTVGGRILLSISSMNGFELSGFTINGDSSNQTLSSYGCVISTSYDFNITKVRFRQNLRVSNTAGYGLLIKDCAATATFMQEQLIENCICENNGGSGARVENSGKSIVFKGGRYNYNSAGVSFVKPSTVVLEAGNGRFIDVDAMYNTTTGIGIGGFTVYGVNGSTLIYGHGSDTWTDVEVTNCRAWYNGSYGLSVQNTRTQVTGGSYNYNGTDTSGDYAGILLNAEHAIISGVILKGNNNWNIDAGGLLRGTIENCHCIDSYGDGINLGGAIDVIINGCTFRDCGVRSGGADIALHTGDGGGGYGFNQESRIITISNCNFTKSTTTGWGIYGNSWVGSLKVLNNHFGDGYGAFRALNAISNNGIVRGNKSSTTDDDDDIFSVTWATSVNVPDIIDEIKFVSINGAYLQKITYLYGKTNGVCRVKKLTSGEGYTGTPTVTLSGGDGSDAAFTAVRAQDGTISHLNTSSVGDNYTVVPTVTLSGGGATTQATFQAYIGNGLHNGRTLRVLFPEAGTIIASTWIKLNNVATGSTLTMTAGSEIIFSYKDGIMREVYRIMS